jgi:hypothetical protein
MAHRRIHVPRPVSPHRMKADPEKVDKD